MRSNYEMFSNWVPGVGDLPTHVANQIAVMPGIPPVCNYIININIDEKPWEKILFNFRSQPY